jgi:hypothetical protein
MKSQVVPAAVAAISILALSGCLGTSVREKACENFATATNARVMTENQYRNDASKYAMGSDELEFSATVFQEMFRREYRAAVEGSQDIGEDNSEAELGKKFDEVAMYGEDLPSRSEYLARDKASRAVISHCKAEGFDVLYLNLSS